MKGEIPLALDNHEVDRIQAEAGFGEGFLEVGLVSLKIFDFLFIYRRVKSGEDLQA